jgi:hypothetical protein
VDIVPPTPEDLIQFIKAIANKIPGMTVYPFHQIGELGKRSCHKEGMRELGIRKPIIILADQTVQIGRTTAGISYDKNRLSDPDLFIPAKKYLIDQPEKKMDELIEEKLKNKKDRKEPDTQMKTPI